MLLSNRMSERQPRRQRLRVLLSGIVSQLALVSAAFGYGPEGHLIAGRLAENWLCTSARTEIARLADGEDLGEVGLWADRIRSDPAYAASGPWHYLNIATGQPIAAFEHPPEGDVLWAIEHFRERLSDSSLSRDQRADALKFLVHFVVDLHQPLHVGLAEDRGGNAIELRFRGERTNLHRFWDTHAIEWTGLSVREYLRGLEGAVSAPSRSLSLEPTVWATESLALRANVYAFGSQGREPAASYSEMAATITRQRLGLAAQRLAGSLNQLFC